MKNIHVLVTNKPSRLRYYNNFKYILYKGYLRWADSKNIYITSDEQAYKDDWVIHTPTNKILKVVESIRKADFKKIILTTDQDLIADGIQPIYEEFLEWFVKNPNCEFVEVEDTCLEVRVCDCGTNENCLKPGYKIIIPKKEVNYNMKQEILTEMERLAEPKQKTTVDIAERLLRKHSDFETEGMSEYQNGKFNGIIEGIEWQAERMYSKEAYEDALNMQKCSNAGYESKIAELQEQIKNMYSEEEVIDILVEFSADIEKVWNITKWFEQFKKK